METIKSLVDKLVQTESISKQVKILQETNTLFLTKYMLEIDDNFRLYPIEVEAYYYNEKNFPDTCVHQNKLQKNNFNKLYFHRASKEPDKSFLYDRGGVDVCISDDDNYYFGILIRSAWIKDEEEPICGSGRLTRCIVEHICGDKIIKKITEKEIVKIEELEKKSIIRVNDQNDKRKKNSIVFESKRVGIDVDIHKEYGLFWLRSLIELKEPNHPYREKEKIVISYLEDHNVKVTDDKIKELLGYDSKVVFDHFNK